MLIYSGSKNPTDVSCDTISRLHSKEHSALPKAVGGYPSKLSPTNIHHAQHLISTGRAKTTVQVTKTSVLKSSPVWFLTFQIRRASWNSGFHAVHTFKSFKSFKSAAYINNYLSPQPCLFTSFYFLQMACCNCHLPKCIH